jgi:lysophospholipase L1-like esterase
MRREQEERRALPGEVASGVLAALCAFVLFPGGAGAEQASHWVPAWFAPPSGAGVRETHSQTMRMLVSPRIAGGRVRVRITNRFGASPARFEDLRIGLQASGASLVAGSNRRLRFQGANTLTLAPGQERLSDPVRLHVRPRTRLAVSAYLPGDQSLTNHGDAEQVSYLDAPSSADHAGDEGGGAFTDGTVTWLGVDEVLVHRAHPPPTVVALGDSLTDGHSSGYNANARYPDLLAARVAARRPAPLVVNAGITGDVLRPASAAPGGTSALARLETDVLEFPAVKAVLVEEGINDLRGRPSLGARKMIAAFKRLRRRLRARHIRVAFATLGPTGGDPFTGDWVEPRRERINAWIRGLPAAERVDFDRSLRDPEDPLRLRPAYDSGDHLHPNAAGYAAMARAVRLERLLGHGL